MHYPLKRSKNRLHIFHESRKRRVFIGELRYEKSKDKYYFTYDKHYANAQYAIPLGYEFSLFKLRHTSKKGALFPSLQDRIPERENPAYPDYCRAQGISVNENNPMILLGTIGKRGPSSFIFESVYESDFHSKNIVQLRKKLKISQHELALAFNISQATLQRIETEKSADLNTLKHIEILLTFPAVALWQLKQTGGRVHKNTLSKLMRYFSN